MDKLQELKNNLGQLKMRFDRLIDLGKFDEAHMVREKMQSVEEEIKAIEEPSVDFDTSSDLFGKSED